MPYRIRAVFAGTRHEEIKYTVDAFNHVDALEKFMEIIDVDNILITITEIIAE